MPAVLASLVLAVTAALTGVGGCPPADWQSLAQDPAVAAAFDKAWQDSLEGTPNEHEEGGWIYRCQGVNPDNPAEWITVVEHWPSGEKDHIIPTSLSNDPDCDLVGEFHTHPGPPLGHPNNDGFMNDKPSVEDVQGAEANGVPGFIIFGEGPDPEGTTVVPYGPPEPKKPCTPDPDHEDPDGSGDGPGDGSGDGPGDGSGDGPGDGSGDGPGDGSGDGPGDGSGDGSGSGTGESAGDPHMVTFDGYHYDFQATGEFVLVRSDELEIQTRQQAAFATSHVTANTAVAVDLDGTVIEVAEDRLVVDGEERELQPGETITTPGGGRFSGGPGLFTFVWADGSEARFVGRSVVVNLASVHSGEVEGLLGDFDGDPGDDLVGSSSENFLSDGRFTFDETYGAFAEQWRVNTSTSLFTYRDGESPETFVLDEVPGFGLYVDLLPDDRREAAESACREAGVEDPWRLRDCALDIGATQDDSFATEAAAVQEIVDGWAEARRPTPPLVASAGRGDRAEVQRLIAEGADVEASDSAGRTALHWATFASRPEIVADLLEAGADPNSRDGVGETALHIAATFGMAEIAEALLEGGADPGIRNDNDLTPLDVAERQGHDDLVELMR